MIFVRSPIPGASFEASSNCAGTGSMLQKWSMSAANVARN
jgi:hypothetical protein